MLIITDTPREEFLPWKDSTSFAEAGDFFLPNVICHDNIAPRVGEVALWREIMHSLVLSSSAAGSVFSGHPSREGVTTATIRAVSGYGVIQRDSALQEIP